MAQESDNARWSLKPWAGTVDQLARATALSADRIAEATPYPDGYDRADTHRPYDATKDRQWLDAESARKIRIGVVEPDGFQRALSEIDDLRAWPAQDLGQIESLDIEVGGGGGGYMPSSAKFELWPGGLDIRISGKHRTWTAGLRHELNAILLPKVRPRPRGLTSEEWLIGVLFAGWFVCVVAIAVTLQAATSLSLGTRRWIEFGAPTVLVGFAGLVGYLLPRMELLAPGTQPKYQRWKRAIVAATTAIVLGVIAGIIVAVLTG